MFLHYSSRIGLALLCIGPLTPLVVDVHPRIVSVPLVAGVAMLFLGLYRHLGHLCGHCAESMPLDMGQAADRRRLLLRLVHQLPDPRRWTVLASLVLLVALVMAAIAAIGLGALTVFHVAIAVLWIAIETHMRYQPWCPWCRHGRGDGDDTPTPDPTDPREDHALIH